MTKRTKHIRDFLEYALYEFTLYFTYLLLLLVLTAHRGRSRLFTVNMLHKLPASVFSYLLTYIMLHVSHQFTMTIASMADIAP